MDNNPEQRKSYAPYFLGILCLIPLVGFFVGIGLLIYALAVYKDKWLALIGVFGIVFTIFVYSTLFYVEFHSDFGKKGFAALDTSLLTGVVKSIEFYKLQHGQYPDSLKQLTNDDKMVMIDDPIYAGKNRNNLFNYQKTGDKYTVFSSGIDGVPHTQDDIYPSLKNFDSAKTGFIRIK